MFDSCIHYVISFRFLNFLWMIGCAVYAFRRWLLQDIKQAIASKKEYLHALKQSIQSLLQKRKELSVSLEQQEHHKQELLQKIARWNMHVAQVRTEREKQLASNAHAYHAYKAQQYAYLEKIYLKKELGQAMMSTLVHKVQQECSNESNVTNFNTKLMQFLKEVS